MNKYLNLINPTAEDIKVIGRIVSIANDGVVASAYQIWDEYLHMWQGEINKKLYEYAVKHEGNIDYINDELENINDQLEKIKMGGIVDIIVNGVNMRNGSEVIVDLGTVIRDLSNYYTKNETYNKEEVQNLVNRLPKMTIIKVDVLPEDPSQYVENIVLVPANPGEENNYYDEYIVSISETETPDGHGRLNYAWEKIGSTKVDLSNYATTEDLADVYNYVDDNVNNLDLKITGARNYTKSIIDDYLPEFYIPLSQKGQANGVATLNSNGMVPEMQLQFPTRGQLNVANIDNLEAGVYQVNGKVISPEILNGEQANGILVAYPYGSKVQVLYVGRAAGAASGEQVEVYTRRYLATPQRWTEWSNIGSDKYTLTKNGTNIELKKNGSTISSVADSNTTYTTMTSAQASAGTSTTGQLISAKVLNDLIGSKTKSYVLSRDGDNIILSGSKGDDSQVDISDKLDRIFIKNVPKNHESRHKMTLDGTFSSQIGSYLVCEIEPNCYYKITNTYNNPDEDAHLIAFVTTKDNESEQPIPFATGEELIKIPKAFCYYHLSPSDANYIIMNCSVSSHVIIEKFDSPNFSEFVIKEEGKGLSTNDFTDEDRQVIINIQREISYVLINRDELEPSGWYHDKSRDTITREILSGKKVIALVEDGDGETGIYNYCTIDGLGVVFARLSNINNNTITWDTFTIEESGDCDRREFSISTSGGSADLSNYYTKAESDAKYLTEHQDISDKANQSDLLALDQRVTNNIVWVENYVRAGVDGVLSEIDSRGYLTEHQDISGKANVSDLAAVATSGSYNDLSNKPTIPTVPTNVSAFTNDAGYLTEHQSLSNYITNDQLDERLLNNIIYGELTSTNEWQPTSLSDDEVRDILMTGGGQTLCISGDSVESLERRYYANLIYRDNVLNGSVLQDVFVYVRPLKVGSNITYRTYTITISVLGIGYSYGNDDIGE